MKKKKKIMLTGITGLATIMGVATSIVACTNSEPEPVDPDKEQDPEVNDEFEDWTPLNSDVVPLNPAIKIITNEAIMEFTNSLKDTIVFDGHNNNYKGEGTIHDNDILNQKIEGVQLLFGWTNSVDILPNLENGWISNYKDVNSLINNQVLFIKFSLEDNYKFESNPDNITITVSGLEEEIYVSDDDVQKFKNEVNETIKFVNINENKHINDNSILNNGINGVVIKYGITDRNGGEPVFINTYNYNEMPSDQFIENYYLTIDFEESDLGIFTHPYERMYIKIDFTILTSQLNDFENNINSNLIFIGSDYDVHLEENAILNNTISGINMTYAVSENNETMPDDVAFTNDYQSLTFKYGYFLIVKYNLFDNYKLENNREAHYYRYVAEAKFSIKNETISFFKTHVEDSAEFMGIDEFGVLKKNEFLDKGIDGIDIKYGWQRKNGGEIMQESSDYRDVNNLKNGDVFTITLTAKDSHYIEDVDGNHVPNVMMYINVVLPGGKDVWVSQANMQQYREQLLNTVTFAGDEGIGRIKWKNQSISWQPPATINGIITKFGIVSDTGITPNSDDLVLEPYNIENLYWGEYLVITFSSSGDNVSLDDQANMETIWVKVDEGIANRLTYAVNALATSMQNKTLSFSASTTDYSITERQKLIYDAMDEQMDYANSNWLNWSTSNVDGLENINFKETSENVPVSLSFTFYIDGGVEDRVSTKEWNERGRRPSFTKLIYINYTIY